MKPKSELMARKRQERRDKGLIKAEVYIYPQDREKLHKYVTNRLHGEYYVKRVK
jgi:hypothetical protein